MCTGTLSLSAPAKINLYLEVVGRRPDGYHDLRSVVVPVSLADRLEFEKTDSIVETSVTCIGIPIAADPGLADSRKNLATRAALLLKEKTGCKHGARIRIEKHIPVAGGLGGGSSDAAATLTGLNHLWETGLSCVELAKLAAGLGSDIPALVHGQAVCMNGIGERVKPILPKTADGRRDGWWMLIVNPGFGVSTRDVYARYASPLTSPPARLKKVISAVAEGDLGMAASNLFNSLEAVVFRKYPLLEMIAGALAKAGALGVLLSGSGASIFALARDEAHAREIEIRARKTLDVFLWARVARTLPDGVMVAHGPLEA